jgi:prepilin-type N-terminal cleavage/methylation domain-containing protein
MASRRTSNRNAFTLIELIVVMALVTIVAGFGLILSMESYRGDSFRSERDTLVATLQKARGQAINNMCFGTTCTGGKPHGVHLGLHQYVVFQGSSYATRDAAYDDVTSARYLGLATTSPSLTDIVFSQLAGTTTPSPGGVTTISIIDSAGSGSSVISINPEGQISWTN